MRRRLKITCALAAAACIAWLGITVARAGESWKTNVLTNIYVRTNPWNIGTNFLTISNRPYLQFEGGSCVVRVTDAEWNLITNHYPEKIRTNSISFYGK